MKHYLTIILISVFSLTIIFAVNIFRGKRELFLEQMQHHITSSSGSSSASSLSASSAFSSSASASGAISAQSSASFSSRPATNYNYDDSIFENLTLVQSIDCAATTPADAYGNNNTQNILSSNCRVIPNSGDGMKYVSYRVGQGQGLSPGNGYILEIIYPEDNPRSMFVINGGCETTRGFHTGPTIGDALDPPYISPNPESLDKPLSGKFEKWRQFFFLHNRFTGIKEDGNYTELPADGFWVTIAQFSPEQAPLSHGAAVKNIKLYQAPDAATYELDLNLPAGQPHRQLFFREEMADQIVHSANSSERGVTTRLDWYIYKMKLMKFLGMNTFTKDLLEFGANQGWDSSKYGGHDWVYMPPYPELWSDIVTSAGNYGLNI
ncbi:MAG TPA: hypothetical protein VKS21_04780, partial [Spirochaetota bacterium]|nr:hypothetical protein [Spirochaetota bacterium]